MVTKVFRIINRITGLYQYVELDEIEEFFEKEHGVQIYKDAMEEIEQLKFNEEIVFKIIPATVVRVFNKHEYGTVLTHLSEDEQKNLEWACRIQNEELLLLIRDMMADEQIAAVLVENLDDPIFGDIYYHTYADSTIRTNNWHKVMFQ